jgi:hypothetical protein
MIWSMPYCNDRPRMLQRSSAHVHLAWFVDLEVGRYRTHGGGAWQFNTLHPSEKREIPVNFPVSFLPLVDRRPRPCLWIRILSSKGWTCKQGRRGVVTKLKWNTRGLRRNILGADIQNNSYYLASQIRYSCKTIFWGKRSRVVLWFSVLLFSFRSHRDKIGREIARSSSTFWSWSG